jgi:hypothetical protein
MINFYLNQNKYLKKHRFFDARFACFLSIDCVLYFVLSDFEFIVSTKNYFYDRLLYIFILTGRFHITEFRFVDTNVFFLCYFSNLTIKFHHLIYSIQSKN